MDEDAAYEAGEQLDMAMTEYADLLHVARRLRAALADMSFLAQTHPHLWSSATTDLLNSAAVRAPGEEP